MVVDDLVLLGEMLPDSGLTNSIVPVFFAKVKQQQEATPEDSEAIAAIEAFTIQEIKQGFIDGYLTVSIDGNQEKIPLRDSFLAFALLQAELRSLTVKK